MSFIPRVFFLFILFLFLLFLLIFIFLLVLFFSFFSSLLLLVGVVEIGFSFRSIPHLDVKVDAETETGVEVDGDVEVGDDVSNIANPKYTRGHEEHSSRVDI